MHGPFSQGSWGKLEFSIWIVHVEVDYQVLITHTMNLGRNLRHRVMMVLLGGPQDLTTFILPRFFLPSMVFQKNISGGDFLFHGILLSCKRKFFFEKAVYSQPWFVYLVYVYGRTFKV